jgi:hypothetical protein
MEGAEAIIDAGLVAEVPHVVGAVPRRVVDEVAAGGGEGVFGMTMGKFDGAH